MAEAKDEFGPVMGDLAAAKGEVQGVRRHALAAARRGDPRAALLDGWAAAGMDALDQMEAEIRRESRRLPRATWPFG